MHLESAEVAALHNHFTVDPELVPALAEGAAVAVAPGVVDRPPVGARAAGQRDLLLDVRLVRVEGAAGLLAGPVALVGVALDLVQGPGRLLRVVVRLDLDV